MLTMSTSKIKHDSEKNKSDEEPSENDIPSDSEEASFPKNTPDVDIKELKNLIRNPQKLYKKIMEFNYVACSKIKGQKHKEALVFLQQSEKILEFAASCGKQLDRNIIIIVLYNSACAYQGLWQLEKCSKYLDGVIYNMETYLKSDSEKKNKTSTISDDKPERIKKLKFLALCNLQYSAILSQLGFHEKSLENASKNWTCLFNMFSECLDFVTEINRKNDTSSSHTFSKQNSKNMNSQADKRKHFLNDSSESSVNKTPSSTTGGGITVLSVKNEIPFSKIVLDYAYPILLYITSLKNLEDISSNGREMLSDVRRSLYYWKNNPENNEKYLRMELKLPIEKTEEGRSLLGVADSTEWLESFNIGAIMHMNPINYDEFSFFGEVIYEISKKMLLEKVIYLSICLFTMATEIRFIELEKIKSEKAKPETVHFKLSEIYHLKAIEVVCKCISCNSPYINHLISSYHKHYNQNLEIIPEESFCSINDRKFSPKENKIEDAYCSKGGEKSEKQKLNLNLNFISTASPKIKQLLNDLKKKNKTKEKKNEALQDQKAFLETLNENLKRNLSEKKIINIGNSYKFILSVPKSSKKGKIDQLKKVYDDSPKQTQKLENFQKQMKAPFIKSKINIPSKKSKEQLFDNFKPLSARTHEEMPQKNYVFSEEKEVIKKNHSFKVNSQKSVSPAVTGGKEKFNSIGKVPKLNFNSLRVGSDEIKFYTPREKRNE